MSIQTATPHGPAIDVTELRERLESAEAPRVLDVRTPAEFESAHIAGSYNVPLDLLREHRADLAPHHGQETVLVCRSGARATQAEQALATTGRQGLRVLSGGIAGWESAGAPVNRGRQTWELERQVRLVAGSVVAASVLGSTVSPRLKWLAGAIGSGLTVAALSNTCAMGMALSKMPWNRGAKDVDISDILGTLAADR
jgi:rhodanese-related sulfurtransferase